MKTVIELLLIDDPAERLRCRILGRIRQSPRGCSMRDLYKNIRDRQPTEILLAVGDMVHAGTLVKVFQSPSAAGGRPTV